MVTMSRKKLTTVLVAALVVLSAVGVTLALYMSKLEPAVNHFNMKTDGVVDGDLIEEGWSDPDPSNPGGSLDEDKAGNAIPGAEFRKGVRIKNTSDATLDMPIWAAIKMEIKKGSKASPQDLATGDLAKILAIMTPVYGSGTDWFNGTDWVRHNTGAIQEVEVFYYKVRVPNSGTEDQKMTSRLFDKVKILDAATDVQMKDIVDMGGFNLVMTGAVMQGDIDDTLTDAVKTQLYDLLTK